MRPWRSRCFAKPSIAASRSRSFINPNHFSDFRLRMYAMMSRLCSGSNRNIGIPACGVVSVTVRAAAVIPGVVATLTKVGAIRLGERSSPLRTAWHPEQVSLTNVAPFSGSPTSNAWLLEVDNSINISKQARRPIRQILHSYRHSSIASERARLPRRVCWCAYLRSRNCNIAPPSAQSKV